MSSEENKDVEVDVDVDKISKGTSPSLAKFLCLHTEDLAQGPPPFTTQGGSLSPTFCTLGLFTLQSFLLQLAFEARCVSKLAATGHGCLSSSAFSSYAINRLFYLAMTLVGLEQL